MFQPTFFFGDRMICIIPQCMGYRSLAVMLALSVGYAIARRFSFGLSIRLIAIAALIALVGNVLRISSILLIALVNFDFATGPWHDFAGYAVMFVDAFVMSIIADRLAPRSQQ